MLDRTWKFSFIDFINCLGLYTTQRAKQPRLNYLIGRFNSFIQGDVTPSRIRHDSHIYPQHSHCIILSVISFLFWTPSMNPHLPSFHYRLYWLVLVIRTHNVPIEEPTLAFLILLYPYKKTGGMQFDISWLACTRLSLVTVNKQQAKGPH